MRGHAPRSMLRFVSVQTRHIAIDVRLDGEEISGRAGDGTNPPRPFHGWLGLFVALDGLLGTIDEEPAAPPKGN